MGWQESSHHDSSRLRTGTVRVLGDPPWMVGDRLDFVWHWLPLLGLAHESLYRMSRGLPNGTPLVARSRHARVVSGSNELVW